MKYSLSLLGLAALAIASDVHDLTADTFEPFIKEHDLVLAEFFAPWCGHCKALAPEYEEAATTLKEKSIPLAKVDCTVETSLCESYGVEGYPTLKIFRGADTKPYAGPRKAQAIVSYMTKQALPAVSLLTTSSALDEFKTADKVVVVGFFGADDKASNATFAAVAEAHRDSYLFGATADAGLAEAEGVMPPAIVLYKTFDEGKNVFQEKFVEADIVEFARTASMPLVGEIGPETYAEYMAAGIPLAYIFAETAEERATIAGDLKAIAEKHKGKVNFATIDSTAYGQHASNLNLEVGKWPAFAIQDTTKSQKFPFPEAGSAKALNAKALGQFVDDFVAGKIEPSIKSEPIPDKQEGPVTVVVAHNYQDVVINNDKDVLIEFYAPWCGHCKALAPKYEELAGLYTDSFADQVVIAKVDATANDLPENISGFPTIMLFKAGAKGEPVTYTGSRTVEDLANFVRDNGSHHVDAYVEAAASIAVDTEGMPHQAPAATAEGGGIKEKVGSVVSEAAEAAKTIMADDVAEGDHDEL